VAAAGLIGIIAAVLAVVLVGRASGKPTNADVAAASEAAGCTFVTRAPIPNFNPNHTTVPTPSTPVKWNTFPPAAGAHYGRPAIWGFYTDPVRPQLVVHNEEHGGVVLWWGPKTPRSTVQKLNEFYSNDPVSMFGTPIAGLGSKVAITAWTGDTSRYYRPSPQYPKGYRGYGHGMTCTTFNDKTLDAFKTFRDAYIGQGPEGIKMSFNQPGT
jgi:Protein of unknown function (DUF3105)